MPHTSDTWYIEQVQDNPFLDDKAKATYKFAMKAIKKLCDQRSIHDILTSPSTCAPKILSADIPEHSQKTYLTTILTFLRTSGLKASNKPLYNEWYPYYEQISEEINDRIKNNIPTERQAKNQIDWKDVLKVRDSLPFGSYPHVLLSLYTYVPPRRQMDYMDMRVYIDPNAVVSLNHNHFHIYSNKYKAPYMFVNKFKNAQHFKSFFNKEIPHKLAQTIKASLKESPREFLFVQKSGQPYTDVNSFTHFSNRMLKDIFKCPGMSVNVLRHSFATYANAIPNITVGERQRNAIKMGHSLKKTMEYALMKQDPPLSMIRSPRHKEVETCYKKKAVTKKLERIPCPPTTRHKQTSN